MVSKLNVFLALALGTIVSLQWIPLTGAKWSIIDDYRFVKLMGPQGRIGFQTFLEQLIPPDWPLGGVVNRPIYYMVHSFWMLVIGNNLVLWQVAKILTFLVVVSLFFIFVRMWADYFPATVLALFFGLQPGWQDVVPRANAELFALFGLVLYAIGNSHILLDLPKRTAIENRSRSVGPILLVGLGGVIAIASKENFCFSIFVISGCLFIWAFFLTKMFRLAIAQVVPLMTGVAFSLLILHGIKQNNGQALYGQTFDLPAIIQSALNGFFFGGIAGWVPTLFAIFYIYRYFCYRITWMMHVVFFEGLLVGLVLLNYGFYTGFSLIGRYAFPVNIIAAFAVLPLLWELRNEARAPEGSYRKAVFNTLICFSFVYSGLTGLKVNVKRSIAYRNETRKFDRQLATVIAAVRGEPDTPILFESYAVGDVEPLASVEIYLRASGVTNPMFARLTYASSQIQDAHEKYLAKLAESEIGAGCRFRPVAELEANKYFRITFSSPIGQRDVLTNFHGPY